MNGGRGLRLEFIIHNGQHQLVFQSGMLVTIPVFGPHFSYQECERLGVDMQMTAAAPFQYLFMGIMNVGRGLRLEFIIHNGQHQLVFQSGMDDSSRTIPISLHGYNEWWERVEIGVHHPQWSALVECEHLGLDMHMTAAAPFQYLFMGIMNGVRGLRLEFIIHNGQHQLMTAAAPFHYLFMGIMNGGRGLRLEFIIHNGHYQLVFQSGMGDNSGLWPSLSVPRM
eukprot:scaffold107844_cov58-Cyclotella_meneghiniana.AAC.1